MRLFYDVLYRHFRAPWEMGPRSELVELVTSGRIAPCRAIDLGCGTGANAIYLAQQGFAVTGVDFSQPALDLAQRRAQHAGVDVAFVQDDLTDLRRVSGPFDLAIDYGALDDLRLRERDAYLGGLLRLLPAGGRLLLWGFEYPMRWWEHLIPLFPPPFVEGEVAARFAAHFDIEVIARSQNRKEWPPGYAVYLMTRRAVA